MSDNQISIVIKATDLSSDVMARVRDKAKEMGDEIAKAGGQSTNVSALQHAIDDLLPSTSNAKAAFSDVRGTLSEMWENPTAQVKTLAGAVGTDLVAGLGSAGVAAGVLGGVMVGVGAAAFGLAEKAAAAGGRLNDLGEISGMSVPGLSRLSNAADVAGGSVERVSNAMFLFEKNVGENAGKVDGGLHQIGLSLEEIQKLDPDEQFTTMARAIASVEDPIKRNSAGFDIFGRQFRDMVPFIMKMNEALEQTADIRPWTEEEAREAERFEMQLQSLKVHAEAWAIAIGRELIPAVSTLVGWIVNLTSTGAEIIGWGTGIIPIFHAVSEAIGYTSAAIDVLRGTANELPKVTGDAKHGVDAWKASLDPLAQSHKMVADTMLNEKSIVTELNAEYQRTHAENLKRQREAEAAQKKFADSMVELNAAGIGWEGTLDTIDGTVVEAIKYYLEAGVSQDKLATAYGLTAVQIKSVVSALKEETEEQKVLAEIHKLTFEQSLRAQKLFTEEQQRQLKQSNEDTAKSIEATSTLWQEYYDAIAKESLSTTDYQLLQVQRWFDGEVAKLADDDVNWNAHYDALYARAQQKMAEIARLNDPLYQDWKKLTGDMHSDWENLFDALPHGASSALDAVKKLFGDLRDDILKIFSDILRGWVEGLLAKMLGGGQSAQPGLAGIFSGLMSQGGGAGGGPSGGLGGLLGGVFNHGGGSSTPIQAGGFNEAGEWVSKTGGGLGSAMRFGGGGLMAATGFMELLGAQGKVQNTLAGAQTGAGIGTMILPGIGTAIGAGAGALVGLLKGLFSGGPSKEEQAGRTDVRGFEQEIAGSLTSQQKAEAGGESWKATVIGVRDAYLQVGKTAAEAEHDVAAMWAAEKNGPAAVAAAMKPMHDAFAQLDKDHALLSKYGVGWTELGAEVKNSHIRDETQGILEDFAGLQRQGLDNITILNHTHGQFSSLYQDIVKAGVDAPASLRELFQPLIDMGLLVDADGKKVTDLANIHFADATKAADGLKAAINGLPRSIDVDVNMNRTGDWDPTRSSEGAGGFSGDAETHGGLEGHARGGLFAVPHVARIAENEPEIIGDQGFMTRALEGAMRRLGAASSSSAAAPVFNLGGLSIAVSGDGNPAAIAAAVHRTITDKVVPAFLDMVRRNEGGTKTAILESAGLAVTTWT